MPRRSLRKGIGGEEREYVRVFRKQPPFGAQDERIVAPLAERREPQVPIESRLVGRRCAALCSAPAVVTEGIRNPGLAVVRTLEFDFVTVARHHREQSVPVGDSKRIEQGYR